ncbi:MAG: NAD(P)/FAD-dependent oxidoreductase [Candidatus Cloacimonetes bacterium]|nr:NAD(P)/FAD-dependent oxidoreductase [Candidatus Cloacimonadota bacterium]
MKDVVDVVIIGGGVVGSAVARELSRYDLRICVLEKNFDVCYETSGRNTGVVHGGFAYDSGSLKAKLCVEGNRIMGDLSKELGFDFKRCGKVLVGNTEQERSSLERTMAQGERNGVQGLRIIEDEELHQMVPSVVGKFAMFSPNSGIIDPFGYTISLAENAVQNGVRYYLKHEVTSIRRNGGCWEITAGHQQFCARWVINSAGLGCKKISDMLGLCGLDLVFSKDDYIVLDNRLGSLVPMPIYTVPSNTYMGIHVTVTTDGNVLLGPTAEDRKEFENYGVEQKNIDYLVDCARALWPHFTKADFIRTYCGVLPKWVDKNGLIQDFGIEINDDFAPNAINLFGIESPGLTASIPIARTVISMMKEREHLLEKADFNPVRKKILRFSDQSPEEQESMIAQNSDYGEVICRCQKVTKAEILQAIHNPLGASSMISIKYRTRCMMGRCQGGYCQMRIAQMLQDELGINDTDLLYSNEGSNLFFGKVRKKAGQ